MTCYNPTIEGFKALFVRDFPYLPVWKEGTAYFINDKVFESPNFYISLVDGNLTQPSQDVVIVDPEYTNKWALYNDNINNYISDTDIGRAFGEAKINFNPSFFPDNATTEMIFYYLAAHYLVIDIQNALNPFALGFNGFTQSKSVGSVSESYGIPQWMLNNPVLSGYAQTGFGRKYLSLIKPYLVGNIIYTPGRVNFG